MRVRHLGLLAAAAILAFAPPAFAVSIQSVDLGVLADPVCTGDTDTCTLIALIKKLNSNITALRNTQPAPGQTDSTHSIPVVPPNDCLPYHYLSTASTNANNLKSSPGSICSGFAHNTTGALCYAKFYNLAVASTPGSATGLVWNIPIPASTSGAGTPLPGGFSGTYFNVGISFEITAGLSDTDNSNCTTGVTLNLSYK